ncbi:MAG: P27 family phage terminase small subunit [Roseburia sp.]|nr:P27 family phage terminase small subunit [Roseburia sp.]MCM1097798.1 P27 family phage terminase small subunit [Ruminococcus flavefaciens]
MKQADIKKGLINQLEKKGAKTAHFLSLVEDYMFLHGQVQKMKTSIRQKGMEYEAVSAAGKTYQKENPAAKNIILYNRQMLAILKELGLSTDGLADDEDDEL